MISSKLQNVIVRTMQGDLEAIQRGEDLTKAKIGLTNKIDKVDDLLKQAEAAMKEARLARKLPHPEKKKIDFAEVNRLTDVQKEAVAAEVDKKEEARRKAEEEARRKAEEEKRMWKEVLEKAEDLASVGNIPLEIEGTEQITNSINRLEKEIELVHLELAELPAREKLILPEKSRLLEQKQQLEKEQAQLLSQLENIKKKRTEVEQAEVGAKAGEERRKYEEQRWQLANRQKEFEQEKWNKKDSLADIVVALNKIEERSRETEQQVESYNKKLNQLSLEKEFLLLKKERFGLLEKINKIESAKKAPLDQLRKIGAQKEVVQRELGPILIEEKEIEKQEAGLKRAIEASVDSQEKRKLTEKRWAVEKERERVEKNRWTVEQKASALHEQYKQAMTVYRSSADEEARVNQRMKEVDLLLFFGLEKGRSRLEEKTKKEEELRNKKTQGVFTRAQRDKLSEEVSDAETAEKQTALEKESSRPWAEEITKAGQLEIKEPGSGFTEDTPPKIERPEIKKENIAETKKPAEINNQTGAAEQEAVSAPEKEPPRPEAVEPPARPTTARDTFIEQLKAAASEEEVDREKFLNRIRGQDQSGLPANPFETKTQEGVIFRPVPQSPDKKQKIITRALVILLLLGLGVLIYLIIRGYLL